MNNLFIGQDGTQEKISLNNLLVAGKTGSGRFNFINHYLSDLRNSYSPEDLRIILVDAKSVLFSEYSNSAHLMLGIVSNEADFKKASGLVVSEMKRRLAENLVEPAIAIVIDEIADFILADKDYFENTIKTITQNSAKINIYLVASTARADNKILSANILNNFPQRVVFGLNNAEQSALVLGEAGAEQLSLPGQCIFKNMDTGEKEFLKIPYAIKNV